MEPKTSAIILAGGKNTRMRGEDKAFLKIGKEALIIRQIRMLKKIFKNIIIVTNSPKKYKDFKQVKIITDIIPYQGPLGGILSGLLASRDKYNFVIACDMPFISKQLVRYMIKKMDNYDVVIPKISGRFHPLFGVYSKECITVIEEMLRRDRLRISSIFTKVRTHFVLKNAIEKFDKKLLSLVNINSEEELAVVQSKFA